jgi:hypothetical protein
MWQHIIGFYYSQSESQTHECIIAVDVWMDGWMYVWMDGWMDSQGHVVRLHLCTLQNTTHLTHYLACYMVFLFMFFLICSMIGKGM